MTDLAWASAALAVAGGALGAPGLILIGVLGVLAEAVRAVWRRFGLVGVEYERHLGAERAVCGDVIPLDVTVRNRKLLPLAWIRAVDVVSSGVVVREGRLVGIDPAGSFGLANAWTLRGFERVVRHYHLLAERRGVYSIGPVRLSVSDVFARTAVREERTGADVYLVRPRMVPVSADESARAWLGPHPARRGLLEDSMLFAGTRPYAPGDPVRRVHWKATARTGRPQVKRYDPAQQREVLIALDIGTPKGDISIWDWDDELVEGLCVTAASLARDTLDQSVACGLAVTAFVGATRRFAWVAPGTAPAQLGRIGDLLARLSSVPSAPFGDLLAGLPAILRPGTTVFVVSGRDPGPRLRLERRLAASGFAVRHVAYGQDGEAFADRARRAGIPAAAARLEPDWRTSDALRLVG